MSQPFHKSHIVAASLAVAVTVSLLAYLATTGQGLLLLGSFGSSALLLFGLPEAALSQPRNVVLGHVGASLIALACLALLGAGWWVVGVATGLAVGFMMLTRTVHPPAGANPIIIFLSKPGWGLFLGSTLAGAIALVALAVVYHRMAGRHKYPVYWHRLPDEAAG